MAVEQGEQILFLLIGAILIEGLALTILSYLVLKSKGEPPVIEEVFTVYGDGRLLAHVNRQKEVNVDDDIFAGMLTVVKDFVKDSFKSRDGEDVKKIEFGKKSILLERGQFIFLAVVYTGDATKKMHEMILNTIDTIESKYKGMIEKWDGDMGVFKEVEEHTALLLGPVSHKPSKLKNNMNDQNLI